jgi:hypothetical protein
VADSGSIPEEVAERARRRLELGARDLGAAVWCDITEPALPGRAIRTVVTDGESFEVVDWLDRRAPRADLLIEPIEEAVERRVCSICPEGARMPMLRAFGLWFEEGQIPIKLGPEAVAPSEPQEMPRPDLEEPGRRAA